MKHLTRDQCEKLRSIGYPQETDFAYDVDTLEYRTITWAAYKELPEGIVACPTLDDLIEWIGYEDFMLFYNNLSDEETGSIGRDKGWYASKSLLGGWEYRGDTPLEAVYVLCLAIKGDNHEKS